MIGIIRITVFGFYLISRMHSTHIYGTASLKNVGCFNFSRFIDFAIYLDIYYI